MGYSQNHICYALRQGTKTENKWSGSKLVIPPRKVEEPVIWLRSDPRNRQIPFQLTPTLAILLDLDQYGMKVTRSAFRSQESKRRISEKKDIQIYMTTGKHD